MVFWVDADRVGDCEGVEGRQVRYYCLWDVGEVECFDAKDLCERRECVSMGMSSKGSMMGRACLQLATCHRIETPACRHLEIDPSL